MNDMIQIKTNSDGLVQTVNYSESPIEGFTQIASIPKPEEREGKYPVMYFRDGKIVYEYLDLPEVPEEDPEQQLAEAKDAKIAEITAYDKSDAVNQFYLNGTPCWLDRDTRVSLMNSTTITRDAGQENTVLWLNGKPLTIPCDTAIELLSRLEMYALKCYNKTAEHKANVQALTTAEQVKAYDYTTGYPEKLQLKF